MSNMSIGGMSANFMHPARGAQQSSPLHEKMSELVDAARNRPDRAPSGPATEMSSTERLEHRIEHAETRAAEVSASFDTLTANMQSNLAMRAERAATNGNQERADRIMGKSEELTTRIETASTRISSHLEENIERMRQRLEALYVADTDTAATETPEAESTIDTQA